MINGGGDVSVQSSGISINLITKSGSNMFKGSAVGTLTNDALQFQNVSRGAVQAKGTSGFLSGAPLNRVTNVTFEYRRPDRARTRLWFWVNADHQDINTAVLNYYDASKARNCAAYADAQRLGTLAGTITYDNLDEVRDCLNNDKTVIYHVGGKVNYQLNPAHRFQYLIQGDDKIQNSRGASATTAKEATNRQFSDYWHGFPQPTHSLTHTFIASDKLVFNKHLHLCVRRLDQRLPGLRHVRQDPVQRQRQLGRLRARRELPLEPAAAAAADDRIPQPLAARVDPAPAADARAEDRRHLFRVEQAGRRPLAEVRRRLPPRADDDVLALFGRRARAPAVQRQRRRPTAPTTGSSPARRVPAMVPYQAELYRDALRNSTWWSYNGYIQDSYNARQMARRAAGCATTGSTRSTTAAVCRRT